MILNKRCIFSILLIFLLLAGQRAPIHAQVDNRVPFKHRVGNPAPEANLFRIRGDFAIIGNTNLTRTTYSDSSDNSGNEMIFVDVDQDSSTLNSSSATLMFSQENESDPSCTDVLYAGLYWSGRAEMGKGMTFESAIKTIPGMSEEVDGMTWDLFRLDELPYTSYVLGIAFEYDSDYLMYPTFTLMNTGDGDNIQFRFTNNHEVEYAVVYGHWKPVENLKITTSAGIAAATFTPITFSERGIDFTVGKLSRPANISQDDYRWGDNSMQVVISGTYTPLLSYTVNFDKRKVKLKGPGATDYTEITAAGNNILFPHEDLRETFVGYADVTDYVKSSGMGEYTVANVALAEGWGDEMGFYGHWGLVVVYQNAKMEWRDVTVFDGYSFVQSLDLEEQVGEIEIEGFGAVKQGPVDLKLGLMAGEGDRSIAGDFLEIIDQNGDWIPLKHPLTTSKNFFNSSIYTPVRNNNNALVENPRNPRLLNNTGIDVVLWDIPNPDNSVIANEQTSVRFRFGTKQDVYSIYAFAFSVRSYSPDVQVANKVKSINNEDPGEEPIVKPGQEMTYHLEVRNKGKEAAEQVQIIIPIPHTTTFVSAHTLPEGYGKVTFDPDRGSAGAIIWDMGDVPLLADLDEVIAILQYTLKVTEDCFVLANDNCQATVAINGTISGIGSVSESVFSNLPFTRGNAEGECSEGDTNDPLEIPITGRAEFALMHCAGYELFSSLGDINLPDFCQKDTPVDLLSLIAPTQENYSVYFFTEETGGSPLFNYSVNTGIAGSEKIWVSEGPAGSCTGFRVPVQINVSPVSPIPHTYDKMVCSYPEKLNYGVSPAGDYQLLYYLDNNPSSLPMKTIPEIDASSTGEFAVWVSQYKEGECESSRQEVRIVVQDCPRVFVSIVPDVDIYHSEGQIITYTVVVENIGKTPLVNVNVAETLTNGAWVIPILLPSGKKTFTTAYTINSSDMIYKMVSNSVYAEGADSEDAFVSDYKYVDIISFTPGLLDYVISLVDVSCRAGGDATGILSINFQKGRQTGSYELVRLVDGYVFSGYFDNKTYVDIEVPSGEYSLTLSENGAFSYAVPGTYKIEEIQSVAFTVPEEIKGCIAYNFFPEADAVLNFNLRSPNGSLIPMQARGFYEITESGTYTLIGTDPSNIRCPLEKSFHAAISQPSGLNLEVLPFCREDVFTTVQLLDDSSGYSIKWYSVGTQEEVHLTKYDDSPTFTAQDEGEYAVTLTNGEGCISAKGRIQVVRSYTEPPQLSTLYTICPTNSSNSFITAAEDFVTNSWYREGIEVSNSLLFLPDQAGSYSLLAKDVNGCEFVADFEVEIKCEPTIRYPNAIRAGVADKAFVIYPDNLTEELEVVIHNRWGEMIFHCKDNSPVYGQPSSCIWNGSLNDQKLPNGSYMVTIFYKIRETGVVMRENSAVMILE
ncbi:MAG TPA: hypothetical protein VKX33_03140 [Cyclobacteriaceae bacterium]|nr:hypothetical protein [Cyclobacteriaceae bacterium]